MSLSSGLAITASNCNYFFYLPSYLSYETAKEQTAICLPHAVEASHCPFYAERQAGKLCYQFFYNAWFDPTGNRTQVYRFSDRRAVHPTSNRFKVGCFAFTFFHFQCVAFLACLMYYVALC